MFACSSCKGGLAARPTSRFGAGETKTVPFQLTEQDLEYYDDKESARVVEPGPIDVLVGALNSAKASAIHAPIENPFFPARAA